MKSKSSQRGSMTLGYMFLILILGVGGIYFYMLARGQNAAADHTIRAQFSCLSQQDQIDFDRNSGASDQVLARDKVLAAEACKTAKQASKAEQVQDKKQYDGPKRTLQAMTSFRAQPGK